MLAAVELEPIVALLARSHGTVFHDMTRTKPAGPRCYSDSTVVAAIDALALMLTCPPRLFRRLKATKSADPKQEVTVR